MVDFAMYVLEFAVYLYIKNNQLINEVFGRQWQRWKTNISYSFQSYS